MKNFKQKYGPWALITGASSGIGAEFARQLAAQGFNLVLVARRLDRLQQLADQVARDYQVEVLPLECDLSQEGFMSTLRPRLENLDIGLLINNAGFANTGPLAGNDLGRELELVHVNCRAYLILAHEFANRLTIRGHGGIVLVSSTTAFGPAALWANYSASKAYELALGEAMHDEMRSAGVDVLVVCPGPVRTEFYQAADQDLSKAPPHLSFMIVEPWQVVATALAGLGKKRSVVPGLGIRLLMKIGRFLPRRVLSKQVSLFAAAVRRAKG
jgi:uncharacterized protein